MGKWVRLIGAGLLGLLGACRPFGGQLMPGSEASRAMFTPDGGRMLVDARFSNQVYLYDLVAKKSVWSSRARPLCGASFSPSGKFAVLLAPTPNDPRALLSVVRLADGVKGPFSMFFGEFGKNGLDNCYSDATAEHTAVSDDGKWVVIAYAGKPTEVYSTADGRLVYQNQIQKQDMQVKQVRLDPGDRRIAVRWTGAHEPTVQIVAQVNGQWRETANLDNVLLDVWTTAGLALVTRRGIELWSSGEPRLVVPLVNDKDSDNAYAVDGYSTPRVYFSPDGAFAAASRIDRFDVYDLKSGAKVFSHHARAGLGSSGSGLLVGAEFAGRHLRAFLTTGDFVDVDLSIPQIVNTTSFGSLGHYSKNWFTDGSSWVGNYQPTLGPGGRYVDVYEEREGHQIYPLP